MKGPRFLDALAEALLIELQTMEAQDHAVVELEAVAHLLKEDAGTRDRLVHATGTLETRLATLEGLIKERLSLPVSRTLMILLREQQLGEIEAFIHRIKATRRRLSIARDVLVTTPIPLHPGERKRIEATLEKKWGMHITLTEKIDPSMIGGLCFSAGDWQFDATIRGRLDRLAQFLKA